MKRWIFFIALLFCTLSFASTSTKFFGYLRTGVGFNSKGGDQECFYNNGTIGNEFRLGNECNMYSELGAQSYHLGSQKNKDDPFFKSTINFAFSMPGHKMFEVFDSNDVKMWMSEGYVEAGGFGDLPLTYWVGKKYYYSNDVHMNDWNHYSNTQGMGGGVGNIPLLSGKLAVALMREIGDKKSSSGTHGLALWDARLTDIKITDNQSLHFWVGIGSSPKGTASNTFYKRGFGTIFGAKHRYEFRKGFNEFSMMRGSGILHTLGLDGDSAPEKDVSRQDDAYRLRFVEQATLRLSSRVSFHFATSFELRYSGAHTTKWYNVGIRPMYFFTDHYQVLAELGHSWIKDNSEVNPDGSTLGGRRLTRVTLASQVSVGKGIWGRPVIRLFYTMSFWNDANKASIGATDKAPTYASSNHGSAYGIQGELWF
ncbi:MAG: carbohydrate porin [Bacteriovoracaceae bacterium]|nr:carbohydrate porin [Bacteriovoracaceae bacterium]